MPEAIVFTIKILVFLTFVLQRHFSVADPDLQIRVEGGEVQGGHSDPEKRGGSVTKNFFSALRASVWSKNKGGLPPRAPSLVPPLIFVLFVIKARVACRERDTVVS